MSAPSEQRRLLAIMVADIAGYSRMMARDENGTFARLRDMQGAVILPGVTRNHGEVVKWTGDGFIATFASAVDAVRAGVEIQSGAQAANAPLPDDRQLRLRIGINVGDVIVVPGDIYGDAVNIAARLQGLAAEGGIAASQMVRDTVRGKFSVDFTDQGDVAVKNIPDPVRIFGISFRPETWAMDQQTTGVSAPRALRPYEPIWSRKRLIRIATIFSVAWLSVLGWRYVVKPFLAPPPPQNVQTPATPSAPSRPVATAPPAPVIELPPVTNEQQAQFAARMVTLIPGMAPARKERLTTDYFASPAHRALALAPSNGTTWRVAKRSSAQIASTEALEGCEVISGTTCGLVALNNTLEPPGPNGGVALRAMPRVSYTGPFDPAMIPTGNFRDNATAVRYRDFSGAKAMALHPTGYISIHTIGATQFENEQQALQSCAKNRQELGMDRPCHLYAAGNHIVLGQRITEVEKTSAEADLMEGIWRGKLEDGNAASIVILGGRAVQFTLNEAAQPITKSTLDGKTLSFGDRRYAVSLTLDGARDANIEFTGPGVSTSGVLRKQ